MPGSLHQSEMFENDSIFYIWYVCRFFGVFLLRCNIRLHAGCISYSPERVWGAVQKAGLWCLQAECYCGYCEDGLESRLLWQRGLGESSEVSSVIFSCKPKASDWQPLQNIERCWKVHLWSACMKFLQGPKITWTMGYCFYKWTTVCFSEPFSLSYRERMGSDLLAKTSRNPDCPKVSMWKQNIQVQTIKFIPIWPE